jgi:arginine decarboxylase
MFLVGAYQEILGDLHNLFGDTNAIHISMDEQHGYRIERVIEGDSITEVLSYVQYDKQDLIRRMRGRLEQAVRTGKVNMRESALLMRRYEEGLAAYTYLADDDAVFGTSDASGQALPAVQLPAAPVLDAAVVPPNAVHESLPPA